jgi:phospholipase C
VASVADASATHDLTVTGPNGFLRRFTGSSAGANEEVTACYEIAQGDIYLDFVNSGRTPVGFTVTDNSYGRAPQVVEVTGGNTLRRGLSLASSHSWYDLIVTSSVDPSFKRRFAGHVETGRASVSDPTLSTGAAAAIDAVGDKGALALLQEGPGCNLRCSNL